MDLLGYKQVRCYAFGFAMLWLVICKGALTTTSHVGGSTPCASTSYSDFRTFSFAAPLRAANSMTATTHRASLPTSCSQHHSGDMEVHLPEEEKLSAPALSSSQMQQLIRTNEALLKTNESLKELVISVVELLRDPTRHATYGEPLRGSDSRLHAQHQKTSSLSLSKVLRPTSPSASVRDTSRRLSSGSFAQDNAYEGTSGTILGENILPMTFEEIDAETAMYRQKYEGGRFTLLSTVVLYSLLSKCRLIVDSSHKLSNVSFSSGTYYA